MKPISLCQIAVVVSGSLSGAGADQVMVNGVSASSRSVDSGMLFVAVRGHAGDGHAYIDDAFERGATAAIVEDAAALAGRPGIVVSNSRLALSAAAATIYGRPSDKMMVVGITGTNGKTTTNWMVYHALETLGIGALRIGTLGTECMRGRGEASALTSPDPITVQRVMRDAADRGARACVMEASSHALDQARIEDVAFDVGVFTNLTRDHLDYHGTIERYFEAKCHLFELMARGAKPAKGAVINIDDPYGAELMTKARSLGLVEWSFGRSADATIRIESAVEDSTGMALSLYLKNLDLAVSLHIPFIGSHNAENAAAAFAACVALGIEVSDAARALSLVPQVPGRLELVGNGAPRVFVDFAHTPDALERALVATRHSTTGALWVVFGCGGDRDRGKRPEMGKIAAAQADFVVVTSDNPRTEAPQAIIDDILSSGITPRFTEVDRRAAILKAIEHAAPGDTVVVAGKGHEDYQILGTEKVHFSDQEVVSEALQRRRS